jgi:N-acetylneuraminate synthase
MKNNHSSPRVWIGNRLIADHQPPYVIAEMSCNHKGDKDIAIRLIHEAASAGANAIKLQTYTPETMTIDCDRPDFKISGGLWDGLTLYELYQKAYTPWEWTADIFDAGRKLGLDVFSSPFDETAVDFLEDFDPPAYKIASLELTDGVLLKKVAATGKPVILSTGLASEDEIQAAVTVLNDAGASAIILLHCISGYPTNIADANITLIPHLKKRFGLVTGLSDHSQGSIVATGAVALGARVIEKHLVLDRNDGSLDVAFSHEPHEFKDLVMNCFKAFQSLGKVNHNPVANEEETRKYRRSLYIVKDCRKGDVLTPENLRRIRPGLGMPADRYEDMLGKTINKNLVRGTPLSPDDIS